MRWVPKEKARRRARASRRISGAAPTGRKRARARTATRAKIKEREKKAGLATLAVAGATLPMLAETRGQKEQQK